ncbi:MAG: radical SAM protein [Thermoplasmata archaeon]|nr:MAG: radical SAM protein [Thermoplasmata archaeon]
MTTIGILDGYVDEPTCLGVPPYISTYPRYIAGAAWNVDRNNNVIYYTVDQIRRDRSLLLKLGKTDILIVIAGMIVPGRYLSGYPISLNEIRLFLTDLDKPIKLLCGPAARYGFGIAGGTKPKEASKIQNIFNGIIKGDCEIIIYELLDRNLDLEDIDLSKKRQNAHSIREYTIEGSRIIKQHPFYPSALIAEIETYRGCPRTITGGCSFCVETLYGKTDFRPIEDIHAEIEALYKNGIKHIRIGNQPCIFSYMSKEAGRKEFPKPNPDAIYKLFKGIHEVAPNLKTIHIDNANPGVIARYPEESREIARIIIRYHTPGDTAAFGIESVDPKVIEENNLKASAEQIIEAIKILNEEGRMRGVNGMLELLPGINFLFGLKGETRETYSLNYKFLEEILHRNLLIRRINIRQVIPLPNTLMYNIGTNIIRKHHVLFKKFKKMVRENIEQPILKKMLPIGVILRDIYTEKTIGKTTFGRQIGSYPLLVGIPGLYPINRFLDIMVVDYGYHSITGIPIPLKINHIPRETLEAIPGIGRKRANRILLQRPFHSEKEFIEALDNIDIAKSILEYISFKQ